MIPVSKFCILLPLGLIVGCSAGEEAGDAPAISAPAAEMQRADALGRETRMSSEDIERGRRNTSWRRVAQMDTVSDGTIADTTSNPETWEAITASSINTSPMRLPLHGDVAGPSVARVQILLDRSPFSPGIIDGRWGQNTEKALYWLQKREGLRASGRVDQPTFDRLVQLAGNPGEIIRSYTLTADDVAGPFTPLPDDVYEQAQLDCLCYTSVDEQVAELFHITPELLGQLNPGVQLANLTAGQQIMVPNIDPERGLVRLNTAAADRSVNAQNALASVAGGGAGGGQVAKLVISDQGSFIHALDASGRIVYHYPSTLGSQYAPSPSGDFSVESTTFDPWWHYQPDLLTGVPDHEEEAQIPPGPNNAVGIVWMALSKPHYGIHGTSAPETIGYATSHGCVRMTNWDALELARRMTDGTPVQFTNTREAS